MAFRTFTLADVPADDAETIRRTMARHPRVFANGFDTYRARTDPVDVAQAWVCMAHIRRHYVPAPRLRASRGRGSYGFKHEAERAAQTYVANGAALVAAYALGVVIVPDRGTPNGMLLMYRPDETSGRRRVRDPVTPGLRAFVLERDGFRCRRCGATADDRVRLVIDHILPVAMGGPTTPENCQTLCEPCNQGKRDRAPHAHDLRPFARRIG